MQILHLGAGVSGLSTRYSRKGLLLHELEYTRIGLSMRKGWGKILAKFSMRTLRVQDIAFTDFMTMENLQYWLFEQKLTVYRQRYEWSFRKLVLKHVPGEESEIYFLEKNYYFGLKLNFILSYRTLSLQNFNTTKAAWKF